MKILLVSNMYPSKEHPSYGVFVKNFVDICGENNIEMEKIVLFKNTSYLKKLTQYMIYYFRILYAVLTKSYDIIYVHYAGQNSLLFYFLTKIKRINLIFNLHGSDVFPEKKLHEFLLYFTKKVLSKCNKIVVPSEYYKKEVLEHFHVKSDAVFVFPSSGVNEKIFFPLNKIVARNNIDLFSNLDMKIIGYVGRIDYGKGWDVLLESIKILNNKGVITPDKYKFVFIGDGNESSKFIEKVKQLSINEYILRISAISQNDLNNYYNSFDLFCFPTQRKSESLGLVGLEALACGIPVISSDYAAPKYYINDRYNGFKFKKGSADDLSKKIELYFNLSESEKADIRDNSIESSRLYTRDAISEKLFNDILF